MKGRLHEIAKVSVYLSTKPLKHTPPSISSLRHPNTSVLINPNMPFAQLVLGSPGAGKSTFCNGMQQFMSAIGRKCSVVNLDPANDHTGYPCAIDVRNLIKLEEIMEEDELGPNGGVLYALEELENNIEWLEKGLSELGEDYVLFDCPGQVELYTHHSSLRNIFFKLEKLGYRVRDLFSASYTILVVYAD
jgi:GTPase SAR1 family protein